MSSIKEKELVSKQKELDILTNQVYKNIKKLLDVETREEILVDINKMLDLEQQILKLGNKGE